MNATNQNEDPRRTGMINEALALLSIIEAAPTDATIDEDPLSRQTRLTRGAMAARLVAEIIAQLRPTVVPVPMYSSLATLRSAP